MDWNVVAQYLPLFEKAAWLTLRLGLAGIALAIVLGLVCALVQYYMVPVLRRVVGFYIQLSRNTPLLVQLFFIYYGLPKIGIRTDAAVCGIAGLAFLGGSYMAEAFRSGHLGVMDYYNMMNVVSDTKMREGISNMGKETPGK